MTSPYAPPRAPIDEEPRPSTNAAPTDNPLTGVGRASLIVSVLGTVYDVYAGNVSVNRSITTVLSLVFFVLYRRKSRHAATFFFWTTVPSYPVYFGLELLGVFGQRPTTLTLVIAATVWVAMLTYAWTLVRKYAAYIEAFPAVRPG